MSATTRTTLKYHPYSEDFRSVKVIMTDN